MNSINMEHPSTDRLSRLRELLKSEGVDFCIITTADPHLSEYIGECDKLREYFSAFTGSAGTLAVSEKNAYLWTDGRYYLQAAKELNGSRITLMRDGEPGVLSVFDFIISNVQSGSVIGFDGRYLSTRSVHNLNEKIKTSGKIITLKSDFIIGNKEWPERLDRRFFDVKLIDETICGCSFETKIGKIRERIAKRLKVTSEYCYIISDLCDIMYILNARGADVEYVPVAFSYLVIFGDKAELFINRTMLSREACANLQAESIYLNDYDEFYTYINALRDKTILIDPASCNYSIYNSIAGNKIIFVNNYEYIDKHIKNEAEISAFYKYHIEDAVAMIRFIKYVKDTVNNMPGLLDEYKAAKVLDEYRLSGKNCLGISFETISAYKENAAIVHYSAKENDCKELRNEGLYLVDSGGHYPSCTTDITRTVALGELSEYEKKCYTAVLKGNIALASATFKADIQPECLDVLARQPLWQMGLDYRHGTGHGIGSDLSVHEGPVAIRYRIQKDRLLPKLCTGNVISDEPGVYIEDCFGIRLENELLVVDRSNNEWGDFLAFEVLTLVPFEKEAILTEELTAFETGFLNEYHDRVYRTVSPYLDAEDRRWLFEVTRPL